MKGFFQRNEDGSIARSEAIHSPTYSLTEANKHETFDGWKWFDDAESAYLFFAAGDVADTPRYITRTAMAAQWAALPPWIRGPFSATYAAAIVLLDAGDDTAAAALLEYAESPSAFTPEQLATFSAVRESLAAGIASLPNP